MALGLSGSPWVERKELIALFYLYTAAEIAAQHCIIVESRGNFAMSGAPGHVRSPKGEGGRAYSLLLCLKSFDH